MKLSELIRQLKDIQEARVDADLGEDDPEVFVNNDFGILSSIIKVTSLKVSDINEVYIVTPQLSTRCY